MMQENARARLIETVQEWSAGVVSVLEGGHHAHQFGGLCGADIPDPVVVAAVRVLGADALVAQTLLGGVPANEVLRVVRAATEPCEPQSSAVAAWTWWGLHRALRVVGADARQPAEPDANWVATMAWPELSHRLAQVACLAVPGWDTELARAAHARTLDVARGFARAVRRRDWLQAAGAGRWLAVLGGEPDSLGLQAGFTYVAHLGSDADARVTLHLEVAQMTGKAGTA